MKLIHFLIILFTGITFTSNAQTSKEQKALNLKYYNEVFGQNDKDFEIFKSPEEWKTEPVVQLCNKTHISFLRSPGERASRSKGVIRKRILIQDKSALEEFSEFYYQDALAFGIRHIKADGTEKDIDVQSAIKVETDVPKFYADSYSSDDYYKVAIPDLEVGDILDYFKVFSEKYTSNIEIINTIGSSHPIVYQEVIVDVDKWSLFYGTFNGAPEFVQDPSGGINHKGKKKESVKRFILKDSNRAAIEGERWSYTYTQEPIFKIMAIPPKGTIGNKKIKNVIKNKLDVKAIFKPVIVNAMTISNSSTLPTLMKNQLRSMGIKKKTPEEKVEAIYHVLRYQFVKGFSYYDSSAKDGLSYTDRYNQMRGDIFAVLFSKQLAKNKIKSQLVAVVPRYYGDIEDVVTENEVIYGVYVPTTDQYYWGVENYRSANDPYTSVSGATGYKVDLLKLTRSTPTFKKIVIPNTDAKDNIHATNLEITINDDYSLNFAGDKAYKGAFKSHYSPLLLLQTKYFDDDKYFLGSERDRKIINSKVNENVKKKKARSKRGKAREKYLENLKQRKLEVSERKKEIIEDWLKDDFEIDSLQNFTVTAFGRFPPEDISLEAEMAFTSKGYLQKAGPNLILEAGRLITSQVELTEEEINERKYPVDQNYARSIENNIRIVLPEGYTAKGLEAMNFSVDNPYAAFISEVTQEGNILEIKTSKVYKKDNMSLENWDKLVEMLEAAYDFSQKKIILKK